MYFKGIELNRVYLLLFSSFMMIGFTGCMDAKPSDVAVDFAKKISTLKMEEAGKLLNTTKHIELLEAACSVSNVNDFSKVFKKFEGKYLSGELTIVDKEVIREHPSIKKDIVSMSKKDQLVIYKEAIQNIKIDNKYEKEIKIYLSRIMESTLREQGAYTNRERAKLRRDIIVEKGGNVDQACLSNYTPYRSFETVNVVSETIKDDKATVKLELVSADGKSNKFTVDLEQIKKKWKIIKPSFLPIMGTNQQIAFLFNHLI